MLREAHAGMVPATDKGITAPADYPHGHRRCLRNGFPDQSDVINRCGRAPSDRHTGLRVAVGSLIAWARPAQIRTGFTVTPYILPQLQHPTQPGHATRCATGGWHQLGAHEGQCGNLVIRCHRNCAMHESPCFSSHHSVWGLVRCRRSRHSSNSNRKTRPLTNTKPLGKRSTTHHPEAR
jgi:hypothetical protein